MKIEEIPSDQDILMTDLLHRAFNAGGCNPMCHCCEKMLPIGVDFKLATVFDANRLFGEAAYFTKEILLDNKKATFKDYMAFFQRRIRPEHAVFDTKDFKERAEEYKLQQKEVMLCDSCTSKDYKNMLIAVCDKEIARMKAPRAGGCFRVNGKIVL